MSPHREHLWIAIGLPIVLLLDAIITIPDNMLAEVGPMLFFQVLCWSVGFLIVVQGRTKQPLRLCDPGPLIFGLLLVYCVYPSLNWCQFLQLPLNVVISDADAELLFAIHGGFFLSVAIGFRLSRCTRPSFMEDLSEVRLPSPWPLLIAALSVVALTTVLRLANGGMLIPDVNYGTIWSNNFSQLVNSRAEGGTSYFFTQLLSKVSSYPTAALGVGCGLLLARAVKNKRNVVRTVAIIGVLALVTYIFSTGERSPIIVAVILTILFADALAGPIRIRSIAPAVVVLLLGFLFSGYFRAYREYGILNAFDMAVGEFTQGGDQDPSGEFAGMLAKEATMLDIFRNRPPDGVMYLAESALALVPSQLAPSKLALKPTANLLSEQFLGKAATDNGAGVAGTTIGDGFRLAGLLGVPILGLMCGATFGGVQRWSFRTRGKSADRPALLKLALAASFFSVAFVLVRCSIGEMLVYLVYLVVLPWIVLSTLLRKESPWLYGAPVEEPDHAVLKARKYSAEY